MPQERIYFPFINFYFIADTFIYTCIPIDIWTAKHWYMNTLMQAGFVKEFIGIYVNTFDELRPNEWIKLEKK